MINGVLVERTVKDVTPALQTNSEGLKKVLEELVKQYKRQEEEMDRWKVSIHILNGPRLRLRGHYPSPSIQGQFLLGFCSRGFVRRRKITYKLSSSSMHTLVSSHRPWCPKAVT